MNYPLNTFSQCSAGSDDETGSEITPTCQKNKKRKPTPEAPPRSHREMLRVLLEDPPVILQCCLISAIVVSTTCVILETVTEYRRHYGAQFEATEVGFTIFFTVEIILRIWATNDTFTYITSVFNIIDLLSVSPLYILEALEMLTEHSVSITTVPVPQEEHQAHYFLTLRLLRLLRILRMGKVMRNSDVISSVLHSIQESLVGLTVLILYNYRSCPVSYAHVLV